MIVSAVACCVAAVIWVFSSKSEEPGDRPAVSNVRKKPKPPRNFKVRQKTVRTSAEKVETGDSNKHEALEKARRMLATFDDDEASLTELHRQLIADIRASLDDNDLPRLVKIVQKMQMSEEWPDGIPVAIRKAAIDALGWFGGDAIPEIAGFLLDGNSEILSEAVEVYENAIFDADGDRELAYYVQAAAQAINNAESLESILMEINNMRNSVAVETIKYIWENGTAAAKEALPEAIEFFTGEEGIDTPEKLDEWYNDPSGENLDDEDDEEMYGASGKDE